jgi:hypothetical protein
LYIFCSSSFNVFTISLYLFFLSSSTNLSTGFSTESKKQ